MVLHGVYLVHKMFSLKVGLQKFFSDGQAPRNKTHLFDLLLHSFVWLRISKDALKPLNPSEGDVFRVIYI